MLKLSYQGFSGYAAMDVETEIFHGEVENVPDKVTFSGRSIKEVSMNFFATVDDYLDWCWMRESGYEG